MIADDAPSRALRIAAPALIAVLLVAAWQGLVVAYDVPAYIVPSPWVVLQTLIVDRALLADALGVTLGIALTALAIATVLGTLVALVFVQSRWIEMSFFPYAVLLQVTPIVAIAPLIIIWVKDTRIALVLCAVVVAIFPIIANTTLACAASTAPARPVPHVQGEPLAGPDAAADARSPAVLLRRPADRERPRVDRAVVAEFVAGTGGQGAGLAYQILLAGMQLNIPRLFAALFLIAAAGIALFAATVWLSHAVLSRWHESEAGAPE